MSDSKQKNYRCLYNHELLITFTAESPYQIYERNVTREQFEGFVRELRDTQVDVLMCCPQAWMTPLWHSNVDRKWQDEAPEQTEPLPETEWKYYDKAYYRIRRYMMKGRDPVAISLETARDIGLDFFISYRMNEIHYVIFKDCPTHSRFWREHPEYHIHPDGAPLNYLIPEVRKKYLSIISELTQKYDIDGFEMDFMRHNFFFPPDRVPEGKFLMTDFVRKTRQMLNEEARKRNKNICLCVRIPRSLQLCERVGLDPITWDKRGLIDMVNISSHFRLTPELEIEGFKEKIKNAKLYGELYHITQSGETSSGYANNINRRTTQEKYETMALNFWDRRVDGLSFFNFAYTREHSFAEPRRRGYHGIEPPFDVLRKICDIDYLRQQPKHYTITPGFGSFPITLESNQCGEISIYIADSLESDHAFRLSVLRLEAEKECIAFSIEVAINGTILENFPSSGELFFPLSNEALPNHDRLLYYKVPLRCLTHGYNNVSIRNGLIGEAKKKGNNITLSGDRIIYVILASRPIEKRSI